MPKIEETTPPPRKLLPIIYVIDSSGSMAGGRISSLNEAMHETVDVLSEVSESNPSAELKIGVLKFATDAEWVTKDGLKFLDDYYWNDLQAGGLTDLGSALRELNQKLSRSGFLDSPVGYKVPVIIFMSDGEPTDDWEGALTKVNETNKWFRVATKIAIAVEGADLDVLAKIVGNSEAVIPVEDLETLKKLIKVVSVTAAMIGSKSRTDDDSQNEIIKAVKKETGGETEDAKPSSPATDDSPTNGDDPFPPWPESGDLDEDWPLSDWP